ncbi:protein kinase domain-containing protein [Pseudonocardia humida]|uniref:non-specific serine/threonine protein kinase n=1 Tax=Pseudonocardia humida TaxID=2800819 RepID=A0ABT0ZUT0_9PSEU|nr:protein kinase [Pseudonocardia humida]MCO1654439.1 protein kinase [Pseudonocardia humida]
MDATVAPRMIADYEVVRPLGEGNHGHYFVARPPARLGLDEEFVTLKVFGDRVAEQAYDRGVRELRAFAAVRSEYLVRVYDAVLEDTFVYATEHFPLGTLAAPARPLAREEALAALEHAARAAHALHEAGMAHGDINPTNIWLAEQADGTVGGRLSDLGLTRFLTPGNTMTGMGRPSSVEFTDPDILAGAVPSRRTEVWSLGATAHRALSGAGLYGELPDTQPLLAIRRVLAKPAEIDPGLDEPDAALVRDCLAAGEARLTTAEQVADRIAQLPR